MGLKTPAPASRSSTPSSRAAMGLQVHKVSHLLRVVNGDGSFQPAQGEVRTHLGIGAKFSEKVTFVVIDLDQSDFIVGLPDIAGFHMGLKGEPLRVHIKGQGRQTVAPTVIDAWGARTANAESKYSTPRRQP